MFEHLEREIDFAEVELSELDTMVRECRTLIDDFRKNKEEIDAKLKYEQAKKMSEGRAAELLEPFSRRLAEYVRVGAINEETRRACFDSMLCFVLDKIAKTDGRCEEVVRKEIGKLCGEGGSFNQLIKLQDDSKLNLSSCSIQLHNRNSEDLKLFFNTLNVAGDSTIGFVLRLFEDFGEYREQVLRSGVPEPQRVQVVACSAEPNLHATIFIHVNNRPTIRHLYGCCNVNNSPPETILNISKQS